MVKTRSKKKEKDPGEAKPNDAVQFQSDDNAAAATAGDDDDDDNGVTGTKNNNEDIARGSNENHTITDNNNGNKYTSTSIKDKMKQNDDDDDSTESLGLALWELPEVLIFHIIKFVATPGHRAHVICNQLALLCQSSRQTLLQSLQPGPNRSDVLWDMLLHEDYGSSSTFDSPATKTTTSRSTRLSRSSSSSSCSSPRRFCKRLRKSPIERVKDAHRLMIDHTELAYYYLWELSYEATTTSSKKSLTKRKLCSILQEFGPRLLFINRPVSSGGTFLVEVCRARHTTATQILHCVQELVEHHHANVNVRTMESFNSTLTPLCVVATRAMPQVVKYLLQKGADHTLLCNARFRLFTNPKKSIRCVDATPLQFAKQMKQAEQEQGATEQVLSDLTNCIQILEQLEHG